MSLKDYATAYFPHKEPSKIHGEPTFDNLQVLLNQLKANAKSVPSSLGGGQHGHLGLILSPQQYQLLSLTPFNRPLNPGVFTIPQGYTGGYEQIQIEHARHKAHQEEFEKVSQVEAALKALIENAIEEDYLLELRNTNTRSIEDDIPTIIQQLFTNYGALDTKTLLEKQNAFQNYTYDPTTPITKLFNIAEEYQQYSGFQGTEATAVDIINIVYEILRKLKIFARDLRDWKALPTGEKTWPRFKEFFRKAHTEWKEHNGGTTGETGFTTNMATQVAENVANMLHTQEDTTAATNFMQQLTDTMQSNQSALQQVNDTVSTLQQQVNMMNAAQTRHPNNQSFPPPPPPAYHQQSFQQQGTTQLP